MSIDKGRTQSEIYRSQSVFNISSQSATEANEFPMAIMAISEVLPDPPHDKRPPPVDPAYKPFDEESALRESPYKPYPEKPGLHEPPYEPYKGM